jgi:hypothetical protein
MILLGLAEIIMNETKEISTQGMLGIDTFVSRATKVDETQHKVNALNFTNN